MRIIRTLRGDISPEKVGAVYYHEHVIARSPVTKAREMDLELCDVEKMVNEVRPVSYTHLTLPTTSRV